MEPLETTGPLTELGRIAADWFDEIVRRPVITALAEQGDVMRPSVRRYQAGLLGW
ncbi:hypothetical protein ACGFY7_40095 [Streptomyces prunicolor]|uniref:hypothetical protein n=1 Tax=Streptomyces prunicolor TaxID=67348 RepID=UPI0037202225